MFLRRKKDEGCAEEKLEFGKSEDVDNTPVSHKCETSLTTTDACEERDDNLKTEGLAVGKLGGYRLKMKIIIIHRQPILQLIIEFMPYLAGFQCTIVRLGIIPHKTNSYLHMQKSKAEKNS